MCRWDYSPGPDEPPPGRLPLQDGPSPLSHDTGDGTGRRRFVYSFIRVLVFGLLYLIAMVLIQAWLR